MDDVTGIHADPTWPYDDVEDAEEIASSPAWECSAHFCACHPDDEAPPPNRTFSIVLCDEHSRRMPSARCRVLAMGRLMNEDSPNADPDGRITLESHRLPEQVLLEWAPASTPLAPHLPFRKLYYVDLAEDDREEAARRRLHNLGFSARETLEGNVRDFQITYGLKETGSLDDAEGPLVTFHDGARDRPARSTGGGIQRVQFLEVQEAPDAPAPQQGGSGNGKAAPSIKPPTLRLDRLIFGEVAGDRLAFSRRRALFEPADELKTTFFTHSNLQGLGRKDEAIDDADWVEQRPKAPNAACLPAGVALGCLLGLEWNDATPLEAKLTGTPIVDGDANALQPVTIDVKIPANEALSFDVPFGGRLPNHVGRLEIELRWSAKDGAGKDITCKPSVTKHTLFTRLGDSLDPRKDSTDEVHAGTPTTDGTTLSGTVPRLRKLTSLIDSDFKHQVDTAAQIERMLWNIHRGINDKIGAPLGTGKPGPPYFDAAQDINLTHDGDIHGEKIDLLEQWLMWVGTSDAKEKFWNRSSCIGHVQLFKTMVATLGINIRRVWVLPKTERLPKRQGNAGGDTQKLAEKDLYCLGDFDASKQQTLMLEVPGEGFKPATVRLMEPDGGYENFEACARTPSGKLLPGGYAVGRITPDAPHFLKNRGFRTAREVLAWWGNTTRKHNGKTFQRFMAWVHADHTRKPLHCWDVNGKHYPIADVQKIFEAGLQLPLPIP